MARLGDVGKVITGNTPKTSDSQNYASNDICFVKPSDIVDGTVTYLVDSEFYISEYARAKARVLPPKSVLVTCIGIIGKVAINDIECAFNQQINAIIPDNSKCLTEYLAYALQNKQAEMQDIANAPVVPILNKTQFSDIEIKLPVLTEQAEIVERLNAVSKLIVLRKEQLTKLGQLVKSRFIELFGDLTSNTYGWETYTFDECFDITSSKRILKSEWKAQGIPFLRVRDMVQLATTGKMDNEFFVSEEFYASLSDSDGVPKQGDILVSATSTLGKCYVVGVEERFYFKDADVLRFRAKRSINPIFFMEQMKNAYIEEQIARTLGVTTVAHFTIKAARTISMRCPNIALQEKFATFVEQTDKSKLAIQKSLDKLELLKKSLMQEYFG